MPAFSPGDQRDDEQQQPMRPPWLPDGVPADAAINDNYSQGSDPERPSFGERIGAKDTVAPMQPGQKPMMQPAPEDRPPVDRSTQFDPQNVPAGIFSGTTTPKMPPEAPAGSKNPNLVDLLKQQAEYGKPIDRAAVDPATGKPKYRMGLGQRLLGAVADFGLGFSGSRNPGVYIGPGATNHRYDVDEATRQANLGNVNTQIKGQEQLDTENIKQEREATRQAYEGQVGAARQTTAEAQEKRAESAQQLADTRQQLVDLQANKGSKISVDSEDRSKLADQYGLKGNERRDYILTGKLPKDFSGRQPTELETWMQAFKRDNGRPPTADEIATRKARTRGTPAQFSKVEADKKSGLMKAEKQYREDKMAGDPDAEKNLNLAKQLAQESYEQQIRTLGGSAGGSNQPANNSGQVQVTDPRGKVHTFRDQKSADAFKKAARIR
jgi:hypothetical protein